MQDLFDGGADIATFMADPDRLPARMADRIVETSRLTHIPGLRQTEKREGNWRYLLPYMPRWFRSLDTSGYDLVLSSSHACALGVRAPAGVPHVSYIHTPIRYVWNEGGDAARTGGLRGAGLTAFRGALKRADLKAAKSPDLMVANSTAVAERIRRIWNRRAQVIHPPVSLAPPQIAVERDPDHYLWVHRFVDYKRPREVAAAFALLPELRLTMVGVGPLQSELRATAPPNVTIRGWMERDELTAAFASASGFIHVGEEDFGISMVEALAAGIPVLALARGGAIDIVRSGVDGYLIEAPDAEAIRDGVRNLRQHSWSRTALQERATGFSTEAFLRRMSAAIKSTGAV
jgi:glycosyltransferase involved in cell wall biosynthesis